MQKNYLFYDWISELTAMKQIVLVLITTGYSSGISRLGRARKSFFFGHTTKWFILTGACSVKVAEYWPGSFFALLMTSSRRIFHQFKPSFVIFVIRDWWKFWRVFCIDVIPLEWVHKNTVTNTVIYRDFGPLDHWSTLYNLKINKSTTAASTSTTTHKNNNKFNNKNNNHNNHNNKQL